MKIDNDAFLKKIKEIESLLDDMDTAEEENESEELDFDLEKWEEKDKKDRQSKLQRLKERSDEIKRLTALLAQSKNKKERSYWLRKLAVVARTEIEGVTILSDPPGVFEKKENREKRWAAQKLKAKKSRQKIRRYLIAGLIIIGAILVILRG